MPTGIKVRDAMISGVVIGNPDQNIVEGARIMRKEDVGSLIICDDSKPVGIVTREDIVNKIVAKDLHPSKIFLREIMSKELISCNPDFDISEAASLMSKYQYERIPVISMGKLVGIISTREIAKVAPPALEVMTEHLRIDQGIEENHENQELEITEGVCDICGNESDNLQNINDRWVCDSCIEEAKEL